ncbi:MAG: hypothetical protein PVI71_10150 [Desulfobacterales bacterium]|jgi:hypothetical protein
MPDEHKKNLSYLNNLKIKPGTMQPASQFYDAQKLYSTDVNRPAVKTAPAMNHWHLLLAQFSPECAIIS